MVMNQLSGLQQLRDTRRRPERCRGVRGVPCTARTARGPEFCPGTQASWWLAQVTATTVAVLETPGQSTVLAIFKTPKSLPGRGPPGAASDLQGPTNTNALHTANK